MDAAQSVCPACGENALITDQLGGSDQVVCAECGFLAAETSFAEPPSMQFFDTPTTLFKDANVPMSIKFAVLSENKRTPMLEMCLTRISKIGDAVRLPKPAIQEARLLFEKIYQMDDFKHIKLVSKWHMCACCVYISCRETAWPITMQTICELSQCSKYKFGSLFKQILIKLNRDIPYQSIGSLIASVLGVRKRMFSLDFINRTRQLLQICQSAWLLTGRNIPIMITAAAYVVWVSSFDTYHTRKYSRSKFSQMHHMVMPSRKHITEIQDLLCTLSKNLPWISDSQSAITRKNVHLRLDDILAYEKTLLYEARKQLSKECSEDVEGLSIHTNDIDIESPILEPCQQVCVVDGKIVTENSLCTVKNEAQHDTDGDNFLPPSFLKRRKHRRDDQDGAGSVAKCTMLSPNKLNSVHISEIDISDDDMHMYIRSDKELSDRKNAEDVLQSVETD